ncbi:MAG: BON domain-containing protein [Pirellulaceae bacterium]|nr:BON domain-containing protein [Pirellulaceae bacterium]
MRRFYIGLVVAATTVLFPVLALASNQEVAERIADNLRDGHLQDYKIGVKFQNGTAWLQGRVASEEQLKMALAVVSRTEGVERVVNRMTVSAPASAQLRTPQGTLAPEKAAYQPTRGSQRHSGNLTRTAQRLQEVVDRGVEYEADDPQADQLATSYTAEPVRPTAAYVPQGPAPAAPRRTAMHQSNRPIPVAYIGGGQPEMIEGGAPMQAYSAPMAGGAAPVRYDQPCMPNYAWPSYAAHPNYAALTYPKQYSPTAWPFIGPFYPYPQVPLGWRKVTLEWDDGWWMLDFKD